MAKRRTVIPGVHARSLLSILAAAALCVLGTIMFVGSPLRTSEPAATAAAAPAAPPPPARIDTAPSEALLTPPEAPTAVTSKARPGAARARETKGTSAERKEAASHAQPNTATPTTDSTSAPSLAVPRRAEPRRSARPRHIGPLEKDL